MDLTVIILIILGAILVILSYVLPAGKGGRGEAGFKVEEGLIRGLVEKEVADAKSHINEMVDETLSYSMEKTERAMERLTNEKIMAVNEYSDQVLESIHKNHQEVIFLYDMLNDKHDNLVRTVGEASVKMKEIKQEVLDFEITLKEASASGRNMPVAEEAASRVSVREPEEGRKQDEAEFVPIAPVKVENMGRVLQETLRTAAPEGVLPQEEEGVVENGQGNSNKEKILRMHKLGKSNTAIARDLSLGIGEVKLVIDLFEQT